MPLLLREGCGSRYPALSSPDASYFGKVFSCRAVRLRLFIYRHFEDSVGQLIRVFWEWFA
jgi:hypothetical protein